MTTDQFLNDDLGVAKLDERAIKVHVGLTEDELGHYLALRQLLRGQLSAGTKSRLIFDFRQRFASFVSDWSSWGVVSYPQAPIPSIPINSFMIVDRVGVSQPLMFRLNNPDAQSHKIYQAFDIYKSIIQAVGIPELVDDLTQWSTYISLMQVVTSMKQFPRTGRIRELVTPMVLQGITAMTEPRVAIISFALRTVRDSLDLPFARGRLILSEQGHVVTSPVN